MVSARPLAAGLALLVLLFALHAEATLFANDDTPLNLANVANMGFADEVAGDGKGGWSDQGPQNDMRSFETGRKTLGGMAFDILDPDANGGRAVLTFDSPHARTGLEEARIDLAPQRAAKHLYLLHTTCWNQEAPGTPIGTIDVSLANGSHIRKEVRSGFEVSDWWNAGDLSNGQVVVRRSNGNATVGVYLSRIDLSDTPVQVAAVTFRTTLKAVWIVVAGTLSNTDLVWNGTRTAFTAGTEWKAVDMTDVQVKAGTALDLGALADAGPAGKDGRAIVNPAGQLAFEKDPTRPRHLLGFTSFLMRRLDGATPEDTARRIVLYADLVRRQGYDVMRPLALDMYLGDGATVEGEFSPQKLDNVDRLIAELKKRGVYIYLDLAAYRLGWLDFGKALADSYTMKAKMYLGDPEMRGRWQAQAERLLAHVNPYTGLAWKDEPAIFCVQFYNEQELGLRFGSIDATTRAAFQKRWAAWLARRYSTVEALARAWTEPAPTTFDQIPLPESLDGPAAGRKIDDFGLFVADLARESFSWCEKIVRAAGYPGLLSQFDCSPRLFDSAERSELSQAVSYHSYFASPTNGGTRCAQGSSAGSAANYIRGINAVKLADRPLFVTEHNHAFWNPYQHEDGLIFPAYSALQRFDVVLVHEDPVELEIRDPAIDFTVARNPVMRANEFLAACLFQRGDVQPSSHRVELDVPESYLETGGHGNQAVSGEQSKIGLMSGFVLSFPDAKKPAGIAPSPIKPDMAILPSGGSAVQTGAWAVNVSDTPGGTFSLASAVKEMKKRGILPQANASNPEAGVFQSDTGQIVLRSKENLIRVVTPLSEGVSLEAGKAEALSILHVDGSSVPATVAACSVDGNPLATSSRIVLVYSTDVANSGMEASADRVTLFKPGTLPILLRTGVLHATLSRAAAPGMKLYALAIDGTRREQIPFETKDGAIQVTLDTAALKGGPTPFFELVAAP